MDAFTADVWISVLLYDFFFVILYQSSKEGGIFGWSGAICYNAFYLLITQHIVVHTYLHHYI